MPAGSVGSVVLGTERVKVGKMTCGDGSAHPGDSHVGGAAVPRHVGYLDVAMWMRDCIGYGPGLPVVPRPPAPAGVGRVQKYWWTAKFVRKARHDIVVHGRHNFDGPINVVGPENVLQRGCDSGRFEKQG